ncbi:MAG TPA: M20/M25/M40 family metallo-hydrolase, partial [Thermoanaerobaculia bacterium]|nr:M20/M25/M40 family metallo-hydrolase [Thermoanaerobaculia bacterium]
MPANARAALALVVTLLAAVLGWQSVQPPAVVPASAALTEFSAERALETLRELTRAPRPLGSPENEQARAWLAGQLRRLGLEASEEPATAVATDRSGTLSVARVTNLLARLPGTANSDKALLLVAHYDSVPAGPGASDDGAGVATLLETARALAASPRAVNDVLFLLSDGEEAGLLGARAFAASHPWMKRVAVVLNFEARGNEGPVVMFETSPGAGPLVSLLARRAPHPVAFSFAYEVYKRMPNDTDFSVFKRAGLAGLNFAYIGNTSAYHSAQDDLSRLDLRSLQHHGSYALSLARALATTDLGQLRPAGESVYFPLPGSWLARFPTSWVLPLWLLAAVGTGLVLGRAFRLGRITVGSLAVGVLRLVLGMALVAGAAQLLGGWIFGSPYNFELPAGLSSVAVSLVAIAFLSAALALALLSVVAGEVRREGIYLGGLLVWLVSGALVSWLAPGAGYLLVFPLIPGLVAAWLRLSSQDAGAQGWTYPLLLATTGAMAALLWVPPLLLLGSALGSGAAPVLAAVLFLLLVGLLAPLVVRGKPLARAYRLPLGLVAAGFVLVLAVHSFSRFSAINREPASLWYAVDENTGDARWWSSSRRPGAWLKSVLGPGAQEAPLPDAFPWRVQALSAPAPAVDLGKTSLAIE